MTTQLEMIDDIPSGCRALVSFFGQQGLDTRITSSRGRWARRVGIIPNSSPGDRLPGILVDLHLGDMTDLSDFGRSDVHTDGSDAGWLILSEILVPMIDNGSLPKDTPIALVSADEVKEQKAEFTGQFGDKYDNVFFFKKKAEKGDGQVDAIRFVEKAKVIKHLIDRSPKREAYAALLKDVSAYLEISDEELKAAFRVTEGSAELSCVDAIAAASNPDWYEKVLLFMRIRDSLRKVFSSASDPKQAVREWLQNEKFSEGGRSARDTLLTGSFENTIRVLDRASFDFEIR